MLSERGANRKHIARKHTILWRGCTEQRKTQQEQGGLNSTHTAQEAITIKQELTTETQTKTYKQRQMINRESKWKHDNHRDRTNTGIWMGKEIKKHYITNRGYNKRYKGQLQP